MKENRQLLNFIFEDEQLKELYMNDNTFNTTVGYYLQSGCDFLECIKNIMIIGYQTKIEVEKEYLDCKNKCTRPNVIYVNKED